jgi:hypothetical protein
VTDPEDFRLPDNLPDLGVIAWLVIEEWREEQGLSFTGGCPLYRSPKDQKRYSKYGTDSVLVLVHDGGDFSNFNSDEGSPLRKESLATPLRKAGFYLESLDAATSAVYTL